MSLHCVCPQMVSWKYQVLHLNGKYNICHVRLKTQCKQWNLTKEYKEWKKGLGDWNLWHDSRPCFKFERSMSRSTTQSTSGYICTEVQWHRWQFVECVVLGFVFFFLGGLLRLGLLCRVRGAAMKHAKISDPWFVVLRFRKMQFVQCLFWELLLRHFVWWGWSVWWGYEGPKLTLFLLSLTLHESILWNLRWKFNHHRIPSRRPSIIYFLVAGQVHGALTIEFQLGWWSANTAKQKHHR